MDFNELENEIERLNRINIKANYAARDRYYSLYHSIYEDLLGMANDGPEFSYTVVF